MYSDDNQGCGHVVHTSLDMSGSRTKLKIVSGASPWSIIIVELSKMKLGEVWVMAARWQAFFDGLSEFLRKSDRQFGIANLNQQYTCIAHALFANMEMNFTLRAK